MPEYLRTLIVVIALAVPAFYVSRQLAVSVIAPREFAVWRNAWFAATAAAFFSGPYYFAFAAMLVMIYLYARAARASPVAIFFVLLFTSPLVGVPISTFDLFNSLFELNNARLLAIVLLLPIVFATFGSGRRNGGIYWIPDLLIIGYAVLLIVLKSENGTQIIRSAIVYSLDLLIPYFAFSRAVSNMADFRKVLLAFVVALLPLSLIAVFETAKGWYLYSLIANNWAIFPLMSYMRREGMLRATGSTISPIVLGFCIMVAIGCVLALRPSSESRKFKGIALAILGAGLVATVSRGPWVGALVLVLAYWVISPKKVKGFVVFAAVGFVLLISPIGDQVLNLMPFVGSADIGSVTYRQHLFDNSVVVIERNLWFGSNDYWQTPEMRI